MNRRLVPWTFLVGVSLCAVLLVNDAVKAARPGARVPNVRGHWDGFSLGADGPVGHVQSDVTQQSARRIAGDVRLLDAMTGDRLATYNFAGTLDTDDVISATGKTPKGRFALHSGVQFFAGTSGDAGIMDAQFQFTPKRGTASGVGASCSGRSPTRTR